MPQLPSPISAGSLADQVHKVLLDRILIGEYPPGHLLPTRTLADEFGVSSTPVREALMRLEAMGLVSRQARIGFEVTPAPDSFEIDQLMVTREVVEPAATALACKQGARAIGPIRAAWEEQKRTGLTTSMEDYLAFMHADDAFHTAIWEGSGNRHIAQMLSHVGGVIRRWRHFTPGSIIDRNEAIDEHGAIVLALESGDSDAAAEAMRVHLQHQRSRIQQQVASAQK